MESTTTSPPSRRFGQLFLSFDRAVSAGHNPPWIFLTISLIVAYLVLPPLFFIGYSSLVPPMESDNQGLTLHNYVERSFHRQGQSFYPQYLIFCREYRNDFFLWLPFQRPKPFGWAAVFGA